MGVLSPTLQGVVFTATRRSLGLNEEAGKRMEDLFLQDRKSHRVFAARVNTGRPPAISEVRDRNTFLINGYRKLYDQSIQRGSSSRPVPSSHLITFLMPTLSTITSPHAIQVATLRNGFGPASISNRQFTNQPTRHTTGSPRSAVLSKPGRYREVPDCERVTDTAGPTPSQSLSSLASASNGSRTHDTQSFAWVNHHGRISQAPQQSLLTMQWQRRATPGQQQAIGLQRHPQTQGVLQYQHVQQHMVAPQQFHPRSDLIQHHQTPPVRPGQELVPMKQQIGLCHENQLRQHPLIPPLGFVHHPQPMNPEMTALHQAHLHSPRLVPSQSFPPETPEGDPSHKFYQVVRGFAGVLTRLWPTLKT